MAKTNKIKITRVPEGEPGKTETLTVKLSFKITPGTRDEVFASLVRALRELIPADERDAFLADLKEAGREVGLAI